MKCKYCNLDLRKQYYLLKYCEKCNICFLFSNDRILTQNNFLRIKNQEFRIDSNFELKKTNIYLFNKKRGIYEHLINLNFLFKDLSPNSDELKNKIENVMVFL